MSSIVPPAAVNIALERCSFTDFEKYAQTVFGAVIGLNFKALGGMHDGGADGFIENDIHEVVARPTAFFQASKELDTEQKIKKTIRRLKAYGRDPRVLHYATSRIVKDIDRVENDLTDELGVSIRISDGNFFEQRANYNDDAKAAFFQYLQPALAFLKEALAPTFPSEPEFKDARIVAAFLGQEVERRLGTTRTMESVSDALILWALEGTDPNHLLSEDEIIAKVERIVPTTKQFFRGEVGKRLALMSKKTHGTRLINIYSKDKKYCLPFESRKILETHTLEDESLKTSVTASLQQRIKDCSAGTYGTNLIDSLAATLHRILEIVFERQGFHASKHFLSDKLDAGILEARPIAEIAQEEIIRVGLNKAGHDDVLQIATAVLRGVFYGSTQQERDYLARMSRTYMLLFVLRNTPEIINYFNTMSKQMNLYVGSDLVIRAMSEYYLDPFDQMTVNALKIIKQAGSRLIFTETMLDEVHSHLYASNLEYNNHYLEIDFLVDIALASQSPKILIRAFYYAKLDCDASKRPANWTQYLNNFVSPAKMTGSLSAPSMKELRETLCGRYGLTFESKEAKIAKPDKKELEKLSKQIREMRGPSKREELAGNDAEMILCVDAIRKSSESSSGNPYGFKTWYLTQDSISNIATSRCFPKRRGLKYVMRPEFLINYIAHNPTNEQTRDSLKTIFPSLLGVRLGARLDSRTLSVVMQNIKAAFESDPARAATIVSEHADALKSDKMRDFALKWAPPR